MNTHLEGPFTIVFHPAESTGTTHSPSRYEIVDMNGLCVAVSSFADTATRHCLEYNRIFAKESWQE